MDVQRIRRRRVFKPRMMLDQVCLREIGNYRLSRAIIEELCQQYGQTDHANQTGRSHSIPAETEVSQF